MIKNIFLLLAALLTSYLVTYLSAKLFKENQFQILAMAVVLMITMATVGILTPAEPVFTIKDLAVEVSVLILSLSAAAYFCYDPSSSKRVLITWITLAAVLSAFCLFGFYQSFKPDSSLVPFYIYLSFGLIGGLGFSLLLNISDKNRVLYGQSLAFLLASYSTYLLMESDWNKGPDTINSQALAQQPSSTVWVALVLILISFTSGLFFQSKNKTSC